MIGLPLMSELQRLVAVPRPHQTTPCSAKSSFTDSQIDSPIFQSASETPPPAIRGSHPEKKLGLVAIRPNVADASPISSSVCHSRDCYLRWLALLPVRSPTTSSWAELCDDTVENWNRGTLVGRSPRAI